MEPKFQTSFIPKKPIVTTPGGRVAVVHDTSVLSIIATVVFIVTVLTAGGLFVYQRVLTSQNEESDKEVAAARSAFQPEIIQKLVEASSRIQASEALLNKHVVVSQLLVLVEKLSMKKVRFTDFDFTYRNNVPTISAKGEAQSYNTLAQQEEVFSASDDVKNSEFSNLGLNETGNVTFDLSATINPTVISYPKLIESVTQNQ